MAVHALVRARALLTHVRWTRSPHVSRVERRARDRGGPPFCVGGGMGGRTFRGAIWVRVHPSPSFLALWPYARHSASDGVLRASGSLRLRGLAPRIDDIDVPAGTLWSAL